MFKNECKISKIFVVLVRHGLLFILLGPLHGCAPTAQQAATTPATENIAPLTETKRFLYVTSGACYSGNNTTFTNLTSSNQIYRLDLATAKKDMILADYFSGPSNTGDSPVSTLDYDSEHLAVLVENTTTTSLRRIELVEKKERGSRSTLSNNTTALSAQVRNFVKFSSGDFLISKSSALELITAGNVRIGAPYVSATAAPCATSTTLIPKTLTLKNQKIVFLHAAASQNRFGIFAATGGITCSVAQAAPNTNAYPTAAFYDSENQRLFVSYAGNSLATDLNSIYSYLVDENTGAISSPQKVYDAANYPSTYSFLLYGISEMTYDAVDKNVYIATAVSNATTVANYSIEKFRYDASQIGVDNNKVLTKVGTSSFLPFDNDTKCISHMRVGE